MPEIHLLSQNTIDKIAAGEVVERPASVVKELVENAIDAGATAVTVEIKEGGISFIRVTDNGCGIEKEQIKKAFLRHATSKIRQIEDLDYVKSLGFRGEALSSIAAVAQVEVITKIKDDLTGMRYAIAGGKEEDLEEIGAPCGTTFLIRNLFFNTPARRKFLKQPQTEGGYVADLLEHIALSKPEISLKFVNNGQVRFHTSGSGDLKEVIYRIYGKEMADALLPISVNNGTFTVKGFLGKPEINRSTRNFEIFFVNGRYVKDDVLAKALEEGYRPYLMQHKFPFAVLDLKVDPAEIDVNVHPAKMQIRIHKAKDLFDFLSAEVSKRLKLTQLIPEVVLEKETEVKEASMKAPEPFEVNRRLNEKVTGQAPVTASENVRKTDMIKEPEASYHTKAISSEEKTIPSVLTKDISSPEITSKILGSFGLSAEKNGRMKSNVIKAADHIIVEKPVQLNLFEAEEEVKILSKEAQKDYRILGQVFDTYWLIAYQEKLLIVDQHAAHEKVKYEKLIGELKEKKITSQMINPPLVINVTGAEEEVLKTYWDRFAELGFEMEEFGTSSYAVRSMPVDLYGCNEKQFFLEILDELLNNPMKGTPDVILEKLASMACKAAVKGNNSMDEKEMEVLLDQLMQLENPYHCPHGRPTIISMSKYEIEKKFKRITS
ncbi:MAG: DNA mismatch repair endonuclease MutL [Lachnospiraceae bacterium]|nr:DNA mismatch repair endonuclease MutL [Lachnospiraceae bacterium]